MYIIVTLLLVVWC